MTNTQFSSEGFDLGALQDAADNVVLELGGGVSTAAAAAAAVATTSTATATATTTTDDDSNSNTGTDSETKAAATTTTSPIAVAEEWKQKGNQSFQQHDWLAAYDHYTAAIEATPGSPTGKEILQLQREYEEEQNKAARKRFDEQEAKRREKDLGASGNDNDVDDDDDEKTPSREGKPFRPPPHTYGTQLAVYHNNRAATCLQLASSSVTDDDDDDTNQTRTTRLEQAVQDCTIACLLNPTYIKAWVRRATAYERQDKMDLALADMKQAAVLDPTSKSIQQSVKRLQKLEDERLEKLKTETMDKLKDLGNSILGNFGLSLDNFKAVQDPDTGSYNISFSQNNN